MRLAAEVAELIISVAGLVVVVASTPLLVGKMVSIRHLAAEVVVVHQAVGQAEAEVVGAVLVVAATDAVVGDVVALSQVVPAVKLSPLTNLAAGHNPILARIRIRSSSEPCVQTAQPR